MQATETVESSLKGMLQELKEEVFNYRTKKEELKEKVFKKKIEELAEVTKTEILNMFFKNKEDYHKYAAVEFIQMV